MRKVMKKLGATLFCMLFCAFLCAPHIGFSTASADTIGHEVSVYRDGTGYEDYYNPSGRKWQAIASVEATGSRLWAAWMTGGVTEPDPDNYLVVAYSDDGGENWVDPFIIIDDGRNQATRIRDGVLWVDDEGCLWLFYGVSGTWTIRISNPQASPQDISVSQPEYAFAFTILNKPIVLSSGEWLCSVDPFLAENNYRTGYFLVSSDRGETWENRGTALSASDNKKWHEGTVVEKKDGTLWCVSRIEGGSGGGLEQTFSSDGGRTWTPYEANLPAPFRGPGSKCSMKRLSSGNLAFVTNASTSSRTNLTFYLSTDDGRTWSSLLLDGRTGCAYPDIAEDGAGNIYVIWDYGRCAENEIRLSRFTEEDVRAGAFGSENARNKIVVSKSAGFYDLVQTREEFERFFVTEVGSALTAEDVLRELPSPLTVIAENGEEYLLEGRWTCNWFSTAEEGVYRFRYVYSSSALPEGVSDNLDLLNAWVTVQKMPDVASVPTVVIVIVSVAAVAVVAAGTIILFVYRKKKR